jgi:hypothetical protein
VHKPGCVYAYSNCHRLYLTREMLPAHSKRGRNSLLNAYLVIVTAVILIAVVVSTYLETRRRERIERSVIEKAIATVGMQLPTLAQQRTRLVQEKWSEEIRYFLVDYLRPTLSSEELNFLHENFLALAAAIERAIDAAMLDQNKPTSTANVRV